VQRPVNPRLVGLAGHDGHASTPVAIKLASLPGQGNESASADAFPSCCTEEEPSHQGDILTGHQLLVLGGQDEGSVLLGRLPRELPVLERRRVHSSSSSAAALNMYFKL